jgi:hypothetical protein
MRIIEPTRAAHTYRQRLHAGTAKVFPLLCPVREIEWADGWQPTLVVSASGLVEPDCVFTTPQGNSQAIWYVTRHEPERFLVEMLKITPEVTACRVDIRLVPDGEACFADVAYTHTSLGPEGDRFVANFTADYYRQFMQTWENELNDFLTTGRKR